MKNLRKIFLFFILLNTLLFAQVGYVPVDDEIYNFLERMQTLDIIDDYNSFELPKTRKDIAKYLTVIIAGINKLDEIDKQKLNDFVSEFEYDLYSSNNNTTSLIPAWKFGYLNSDKEKYLYYYSDSNNVNLYVNGLGMIDFLNQNNGENISSLLYRFGGELRGSLFNRIGFFTKVTNGSYTGNKNLAKKFGALKYNYKINNETGSEIGDNFFDETESFLSLDYDYAKIKIGNDRKYIGYGAHKTLLGNRAPRMEYLEFNLRYKKLSFTSLHGKLLGSELHEFENSVNNYTEIFDKYYVYHRLQINPTNNCSIGIGEIVIYTKRNIDFSYLNPFNFYKSSEHLNQDRDNSMLFFDFQNNLLEGLKFYSTVLIDDMDFGKIGTGWYGNKTLINFGIYSSLFYKYFPLDFEIQYIRIEPYVFAHRIAANNYTNLNYNLGTSFQPNSSSAVVNVYYRPHHRINVMLGFTYSVHGANLYDTEGKLITNFGGNISEGHRTEDSDKAYFLGGKKEYSREIIFSTTYEPKKNIILSLNANFTNKVLAASQFNDKLFTNLSLYIKF